MISYGEIIGLLLIAGLIWFAVKPKLRSGIRRHRFFRRREFREIFGFWPEEKGHIAQGHIAQGIVDRVLTFWAERYLLSQKQEEALFHPYKADFPKRHFPTDPWSERIAAKWYARVRGLASMGFYGARGLAEEFSFATKPQPVDYLLYDSPIREQVESILAAGDRPTQPMR